MNLPLHRLPGADIDSDAYRQGFQDGFVAPRNAPEPIGKGRAYLAGWLDSRVRSAVPAWRLMPTQPKETP